MPSQTIRLHCESSNLSGQAVDSLTGLRPFFWTGSSLSFEVALSDAGRFLLADDIGSIILEIKQLSASRSDASLMRLVKGAGDCDATFTAADWDGGGKALVAFGFTVAQAALAPGDYLIIVRHEGSGGAKNTYLRASISVVENSSESVSISSPPAPAIEYYTKTESDARYYLKSESDSRYYTKTEVYSAEESDDRYFTKTDADGRFDTPAASNDRHYQKYEVDDQLVAQAAANNHRNHLAYLFNSEAGYYVEAATGILATFRGSYSVRVVIAPIVKYVGDMAGRSQVIVDVGRTTVSTASLFKLMLIDDSIVVSIDDAFYSLTATDFFTAANISKFITIIVTRDSSTGNVTIHVNGQQAAIHNLGLFPTGTLAVATRLLIGIANDKASQKLNALVSGLQVYGRVLSGADIALSSPPATPALRYNFRVYKDGQTDPCPDTSGNNYHGAVTGPAWISWKYSVIQAIATPEIQ